MTDAKPLLAGLLGSWALEREFDGEGAKMSGQAEFISEPDGGSLYRENGMLVLRDGQSVMANRAYRFSAQSGELLVEFADGPDAGKRFVALRFNADATGGLIANDVHLCGEDRYDVTYRLAMPARFATDIVVVGPRKSYRARSYFTRK